MKWRQLIHNGVAFPLPYRPVGLKLRIRGAAVDLSPLAEEMVYAWGKKRLTPYVSDPVFQENFMIDLRKQLPAEFSDVKFDHLDLSEVFTYLEKDEAERKDPELKKKLAAERKVQRHQLKETYAHAIIDGKETEIANWLVEPPGIFMGRGKHPLRGRWKPRVAHEDVILNLGEVAPVPKGNWGGIVHDHNSMWLAYWVDKLSQVRKYVWPSDIATVRQRRDREKYDAALSLKDHLESVRRAIDGGLSSPDDKVRRVATVCYLIDKLAMRVGDEKDPDEADTVGASTLRIEHLQVARDAINFDFLGKDSVRWNKSIRFDGMNSAILRNFQDFTRGKNREDLLFDGITSVSVNKFLGKTMKGLTAKVFRTHHATYTVKDYLQKASELRPRDPDSLKLYHAKKANLAAAIACNHKRTVPKTWEGSLQKKIERLNNIKAKTGKTSKQKHRLKARIGKLKLDIDLHQHTKDYNLNTSLRNYIDPRVYKAWGKTVAFDWRKIYSKTLQRKFQWAVKARPEWL